MPGWQTDNAWLVRMSLQRAGMVTVSHESSLLLTCLLLGLALGLLTVSCFASEFLPCQTCLFWFLDIKISHLVPLTPGNTCIFVPKWLAFSNFKPHMAGNGDAGLGRPTAGCTLDANCE